MAISRILKTKKVWILVLLLVFISVRVLKMFMGPSDLAYNGKVLRYETISENNTKVSKSQVWNNSIRKNYHLNMRKAKSIVSAPRRLRHGFHRNILNGEKAHSIKQTKEEMVKHSITALDKRKSRESNYIDRGIFDHRRHLKTMSEIRERIKYADEETKSYPLTVRGKYVINNPDICERDKNITVLVVIHSATKHFDRRRNIRASYGSRTLFHPAEVRVIFLLGLPEFGAQQKLIERENRMYGDIIQGGFLDTYHNLTLKAVMGLRWVTDNCADAKYVVKADDDVIFDMWKFLARFREKTQQRTVWCNIYIRIPIQRKGKWAVSKKELKGYSLYPWAYCAGMLAVMNTGVVPRLFEMASLTPFFWIDDIYVYGILRNRARGVALKPMPKNFGVSIYDNYCHNIYRCYLVAAIVHSAWYNATWNIIQKRSRLYDYPHQILP